MVVIDDSLISFPYHDNSRQIRTVMIRNCITQLCYVLCHRLPVWCKEKLFLVDMNDLWRGKKKKLSFYSPIRKNKALLRRQKVKDDQ